MARREVLNVNKLSASEFGIKSPSAPNQVARFATGIMDFDDVGVAAESCVIGGVTYTFHADPTAVNSTDTAVYVDVAASAAAQATALVAAINATGASATTYASKANSDNIKPNPDASGAIGFVDAAGDAVVVTAKKAGVGGNTIVFTEGGTNTVNYELDGTTVATTLTGGVDGNNMLDSGNYTNISLRNSGPELPQAEAGGAAATTINTSNTFLLKGTRFNQYNVTTQTISLPVAHAKGLSIAGDQVENEIVEFNAGHTAENKHAYRIGRDGTLKLRVKMSIDDVSGADLCAVGWRKVEASNAAFDDYDEVVAFNIVSGAVSGTLIKNGAATDTDDMVNNWGDGETHEMTLIVDRTGLVTLLFDGVAPSTAHAGTLKFDGNEIIMPFIHIRQDANLTPVYLEEFECGQVPNA